MKNYRIAHIEKDFIPSADFNAPVWKNIKPLIIDIWPWHKPEEPQVHYAEVKLLYSRINIYLRYLVKEKYILARTIVPQGKVHLDSCVEFFVSPNSNGYFNFEFNCIGSIHLGYRQDRNTGKFVDIEDIKGIKIATSLQKGKAIEEAIASPEEGYIVEYSVPLKLFAKYSECGIPEKETIWKANFYKCGDNLPNPSWGVWSNVITQTPDFHRPEFFGEIIFD
ncbi:MAG TPA: hypothetical protein DD381_00680 [Lentisphaeria bacterium]|nr:MAG: hypothetical protein A2X47_00340 [Lentisphaerae bacterium GWF2_38_69]HBM14857.1 hypothetical protein [Lentisphaeria bacterium]